MHEGIVVIVDATGQAGTIHWLVGDTAQVILANGDVWTGLSKLLRIPQSQEELDAAAVDVERLVPKKQKKINRRDE